MKLRKIPMGLAEPDMIPLVDVVFQLVTFFIIAMNFENLKADERTRLPKQILAKPPSVRHEHELVLNLTYQRDASGARTASVPQVFYNDRYVDVRQILADLQQERRVLEAIHGRNVIKDVTVLIHADAEVPAGLVQELIQKCQQTGFAKFSLRAMATEN